MINILYAIINLAILLRLYIIAPLVFKISRSSNRTKGDVGVNRDGSVITSE